MEPLQKSGLTEYRCYMLNYLQQTRQASVLRNMLNFGGFLFLMISCLSFQKMSLPIMVLRRFSWVKEKPSKLHGGVTAPALQYLPY